MNKKFAILGSGSMGTSMAKLLASAGKKVALYSIEPEVVKEINENKTNNRYLPGVILPNKLYVSDDLKSVTAHSHYIVICVPAQEVRSVIKKLKSECRSTLEAIENKSITFVNLAKGLEEVTRFRISQIIMQEFNILTNFGCLTGPSHAEEIARNIPTAVVSASKNAKVAKDIQNHFSTPNFRIYTTTDIVGAELGGSLKNPIAICAGIIDGIGYGDNTKAALITRSIEELVRLTVKLGGSEATIKGLAGLGDLIVTCMSKLSRNHNAGEFIGQGFSVEQALKKVSMVVEGHKTCPVVCELAREYKINMPITEQAYEVLYNNKPPHKAIRELMTRDLKNEFD